jgi:acetolactate decarboxylase
MEASIVNRALFLVLLLTSACHRRQAPPPTIATPEVRTWGTLREVVHEGLVGEKVSLPDVVAPHVYAVGALAGLAGEIMALDGTAYVAQPGGDAALVSIPSQPMGATLLVAATVPAWRDAVLPAAAANAAALDDAVEAAARAAGLDPAKPFPFLIVGDVDASWHVLRGPVDGHAGGGHEAHMRNAVTGKVSGVRATLVGFFSLHHQGVFTHMGQRTHLHVITDDRKTMGHVDEIAVPAGVVLRLPAR